MKKSSKILGSIALSAALVMGTAAPAFANAPDEDLVKSLNVDKKESTFATDTGTTTLAGEGVEDGASTLVTVGTYTSQISVTVPVSLPLYFDTAGGSGLAPTDGTYAIKNGSTAPITVASASYKIKDSENAKWNFGPSAYADYSETSAAASSTREYGDIFVAITPTSGSYTTPLELKSSKSDATATSGTQSTMGWVIDANQTLGFKVEPSSTKLNKSLDALSPIATITYTVKVGTSANGNKLEQGDPTNMGEVIERDAVQVKTIRTLFTNAGASLVFVGADKKDVTVTEESWVHVTAFEVSGGGKWWPVENDGDDKPLAADPVKDSSYRAVCSITDAPADPDTESNEG